MGKIYINTVCLILLLLIGNGFTVSSSFRTNSYSCENGVEFVRDAETGERQGARDSGERYDRVSEPGSSSTLDRDSHVETETASESRGYLGKLQVSSRVPEPRISKYISFKEATYSPTAVRLGIPNKPTPAQLENLVNLGVNFFDKLREHFGRPIYISSFYRSAALNEKVKGAVYSDHMANDNDAGIDIDMDGRGGPSNNDIFFYVRDSMNFYKLIGEFPHKGKCRWIHVSYSRSAIKNAQKHILIATMRGTRRVYLPYRGNEYLIK